MKKNNKKPTLIHTINVKFYIPLPIILVPEKGTTREGLFQH